MTRIRKVFAMLVIIFAASSCFGADGSSPPVRKMGSPEHFELRAAWFLQRMIKADLSLDESKSHAVDLIFADFARRTAEQLPRPVLIAYPITDGRDGSTGKPGMIAAKGGQHIEGEIQRGPDGTPVMLVESLLKVLDSSQEASFRSTLQRWAQIKPEPISMPIIAIMRSSRDPMLNLSSSQSAQFEELFRTKGRSAMSSPVGRPGSNQLDPLTEEIRNHIVGNLSPSQKIQFETTLTFLESEVVDWLALKTGGNHIYADALLLLEAEAKKKTKSMGD